MRIQETYRNADGTYSAPHANWLVQDRKTQPWINDDELEMHLANPGMWSAVGCDKDDVDVYRRVILEPAQDERNRQADENIAIMLGYNLD